MARYETSAELARLALLQEVVARAEMAEAECQIRAAEKAGEELLLTRQRERLATVSESVIAR